MIPLGVVASAKAGATPPDVTGYVIGTGVTGATTLNVPYPAHATGQLLIAGFCGKPFNSQPTAVGPFTDVAAGVASGATTVASAGSVYVDVWKYIAVDNSKVGANESVTLGSTDSHLGRMVSFQKAAGTWDTVSNNATDVSGDTAVSCSFSGFTGGVIAAGDFLHILVGVPDDTATHTSQALSVPGCTLGAIDWGAKTQTSTGNDTGMYVGVVEVLSGSCSGSPVYTATLSTALETAVILTRVRAI